MPNSQFMTSQKQYHKSILNQFYLNGRKCCFFLFNKQNVKIQEHVYTYSIHELSKDYKQLISNQHA